MEIYRAEVVHASRLSAGMVRIVFGGEGLAGFRSTGVGDEYVRVFLPDAGTGELRLPKPEGHGWIYPDGVESAPMRTYTVRRADPASGEVTIDFVVHDGGVAAAWAQQVAAGRQVAHVVGLTSPTGLYALPPDGEWQFLVADATGLPAAARLLERAAPGVRTRAVLEVADPSHVVPIEAPDVEIIWIFGGNGHGASRLADVVRETALPDGPGYVWFAGESTVSRGVRKFLRHERGLPAARYKAVGYWTENAEQWRHRYENLDDNTKQWLSSMWDSDRDEEEIEDEYTAALERLGL
jgi:NADPH-dependent ferric siderophore reductase